MAGKRRKGIGANCSQLTSQNSLKVEEIVFSNVDLLTEILLRLPAVSVLRFKCVAKQWLTVISDPKFRTSHAKLNTTPVVSGQYVLSPLVHSCNRMVKNLLPVPFGSNSSLPSLSFLSPLGSIIDCLDSCNGLLLCYSRPNFVVCNPTTQSYKILPPLSDHDHPYFSHIAYVPSKSMYKVVTVNLLASHKFKIYSSATEAWKEVEASWPSSDGYYNKTRFVRWNGGVHWMEGKGEDIIHFQFDIDEEKLEVVQLPSKPKLLGCYKFWYFGECGGRLFLIQAWTTTASGLQILEMGEGCSGWIVKYRFNLKSAFPEVEDRLMIRNFSIICVKPGADEENDTELVLAGNGQVVSCNLKSKTSKVLCSFPTSERTTKYPTKYHEAFQFLGCLFML